MSLERYLWSDDFAEHARLEQERFEASVARILQRKVVGEVSAWGGLIGHPPIDAISTGGHDFDEGTRVCKRCGLTTGNFVPGSACTSLAAETYPKARSAAADDFAEIKRRMEEIAKDESV